jgi:hypothetical protein
MAFRVRGHGRLVDCTLVSVARTDRGIIDWSGIALRGARTRKELDQFEQDASVVRDALVHLIAAMLSAYAPLAEVLAIVRQHAIAIFSEP